MSRKFPSPGTWYMTKYSVPIRVFLNMCLHQQLKFDNSFYIIHAKWVVLITELAASRRFEIWRCCVAVPELPLLYRNCFYQDYNATTSHFKTAARWESQCSLQIACRELYTGNNKIWAADVATNWGKLLFEINIVGKTRFPLRLEKGNVNCR